MNTKSTKITLTKQNDPLQVDISVSTSILLPLNLTLATLFAAVSKFVYQLGRDIILEIILNLDEMYFQELKENLKKAQVKFRLATRASRSLVTPFGKIFFKYRYVQVDGKHFSPLLRSLGVEGKNRIFIESCSNELDNCLFTSFRKALKLGGGEFSVMTLWNRFQDLGSNIVEKNRLAFNFANEGGKEKKESPYHLAYVMIDGIWEQSQSAARNLIPAMKKEHKKKKKPNFEMKTCRLVLGKVKNNEVEWTKPFVYANNCKSEAFLKQCRDFLDSVFQLYNVPHIVLVSDGASWIKGFREFYPKAVHQLDWWHLWKKAKTFDFFGDDQYKKLWSLLKEGKANEAESLIREALKSLNDFSLLTYDINFDDNKMFKTFQKHNKRWLERRRKEAQELLTYIENNRDCIYGLNSLPADLPPEAYIWGSGPVEKLQGTLLGYRMKRQGRSWSIRGASHMAAALCQWFNGDEVQEIIDNLCRMQEEWDSENERLERGGRATGCHNKKPAASPFNAVFPILERGKTDTRLFQLFRGIRESNVYAG
jgi:hypothetical protein